MPFVAFCAFCFWRVSGALALFGALCAFCVPYVWPLSCVCVLCVAVCAIVFFVIVVFFNKHK